MATTIEDAIYTWMLTQTGITAYVGTDIYFGSTAEGLESDHIRYQLVSPSNEPYSFGTTNTAQPDIQFDIFSKNAASCIAIGNLLATALNRFTGALTSELNVIFSTASGPQVRRDADEQWWHGMVFWTPEYER
jgi:Na+-driven multidrug efflux pump